jgi:hypothetical protein
VARIAAFAPTSTGFVIAADHRNTLIDDRAAPITHVNTDTDDGNRKVGDLAP